MNIKKDSVNTACPYARRCGGCQNKNRVYAATLRAKQQTLVRWLSCFGNVDKIIGAKEPTGYRNKAQAAFFRRGGETLSGIYQAADKKVLAVDRCLLQKENADSIIMTVRKLCRNFRIKPYDCKSRTGYLRHLLVRHAEATGEVMVVLVTSDGEFPSARSFVNELVRRHSEITTVVHNINPTDIPLYLGEENHVLYGDGYITDILCGLEFRISPGSFYQINHAQTELLYGKVAEFADVKPGDRVLDAYCGTGTIGLCAAKAARELVGVELNLSAVSDAEENARRNRVENARFVCADAGRFMQQAALSGERFDTVITDPPRAGCSHEFLCSLVKLSPQRIVYVSCNPETLARNLNYLTHNGYEVKKIQGVDMFPFTEHVETVVLLRREKAVHNMNLNPDPFAMIKNGQKTIELRLLDEKRKKIKVGDTILFSNIATGEKLTAAVVKLHRFNNFEELYRALPLLQCGYTAENVDKAKPSDMEQYYSFDRQKNYGVVGIEFYRPETSYR